MSIGENLYYLRKKAGFTQEGLAEELNISRQSVSKWETGEAYPETDKLIALCDKFNVTMDELVRGDLTNPQDGAFSPREEAPAAAEENGRTEKDQKTLKRAAAHSAVCSCVFLLALIAFLVCGFVWGLWRVCWVSFIFALCVCSVLHAFGIGNGEEHAQERGNRTRLQHISASLSGAVMLLCVGVYLILGLVAGLWHPTWIIFIVGAVVCVILGVLSGDDSRKDGDDGEK